MKSLVNVILFMVCLVTYPDLFAQTFTIPKEPVGLTNDPLNLIYESSKDRGKGEYYKPKRSSTNISNAGSWNNQNGPYGISNQFGIPVATESDTGNLVIVGAERGILRSDNGGNTWQYIGGFSNPWLPNGNISAVAIDPSNSNKIIAGDGTTQSHYIFISEDRGLTWESVSHPSSSTTIDISKTNSNRVITGSNSYQYQLAKSSDGGFTWSQIELDVNTTGRVWSVKFHPLNDNKIFAGGELGLFYSNDFGETWTELNNGIPDIDNISIESIEFSPTNADSIIVSCGSVNGYGPYMSSDGGTSWSNIRGNLMSASFDAVFPKWNSNQLYVGNYGAGLFKSSLPLIDWLQVWQLNDLIPGSIEDIETTINHKLFIGSRYNGVFRSTDGGTSYEEINNGATCANMRTVKINPNNLNEALCAGWSGGIYKTINHGESWQKKHYGMWMSIDISNTNSQICYAAGNEIPIIKSLDGGETWNWSSNGINFGQFIKIAIDPHDASHVIALSHFGSAYTVYQSSNGGESWLPASGIPEFAGAYYMHEIVFDYQSTTHYIFVGTDSGLYCSSDNGHTWSLANTTLLESMGLSTHNNVPVLYGISGKSVYYSDNHGLSWSLWFNSPSGNDLKQCIINTQNSNEIILFDLYNCYYSEDGGQTWQDQSSGSIPVYDISNIDINFEYKTRYIATVGRGIYTWTDLSTYDITTTCDPLGGGITSGAGSYYHWQNASLVATPNIGYSFVNWTEEDSIVSINPTYSFNVYRNRYMKANFDTATFSITAAAYPTNAGNVTGSGVYPYNQIVNLIASSNDGYDFTNWTENDVIISTDSSINVTVTENRNLTAIFALKSFTITASSNPFEAGTITGAGVYFYGQSVALNATPTIGNYFTEWSENGTSISTNELYSFTVIENRELTANFSALNYTITAVSDSLNAGTIVGAGIYTYGQTATLTAIPNNNFKFIGWIENGIQVSADSIFEFVVSANRELTAKFLNMTIIRNPNAASELLYIYPNPGTNILYVDLNVFNVAGQDIQVEMYNVLGKSIVTNIICAENIISFDVRSIPSGIYYLLVKANDRVLGVKKVIIYEE
jgi:photosystem II stability/assembly factor-like uncharacterized protein